MGSREELLTILKDILKSDNVYFDPPDNLKLKYPAILCRVSAISSDHADNNPYRFQKRYLITLIDKKSDSQFLMPLLSLSTASHDRSYVSHNLHHDILTIIF